MLGCERPLSTNGKFATPPFQRWGSERSLVRVGSGQGHGLNTAVAL